MNFLFLGCIGLGALAVFQPLLNKSIAETKGLALAIWINGLVFFLGASLLLLLTIYAQKSPQIFSFKPESSLRWYYILPGIMGLTFVTGLPFMIKNLGAFPTIVTFLSGQLLVSFLWDYIIQNEPLSLTRLAGLSLALVGTYFSVRPLAS